MDPVSTERVNTNMSLYMVVALIATFLLWWRAHLAYVAE